MTYLPGRTTKDENVHLKFHFRVSNPEPELLTTPGQFKGYRMESVLLIKLKRKLSSFAVCVNTVASYSSYKGGACGEREG